MWIAGHASRLRHLQLLMAIGSLLGSLACRDREARAAGVHCAPDMKPIAGGSFRMGNAFEVTLDSFCLDESEVTVAEYARCVSASVCDIPGTSSSLPALAELEAYCNANKSDKQNHPINCVPWQEASKYCSYAGKRLPTEAEWEYAARGGEKELDNPWGNEPHTLELACWDTHRARKGTCAVESFPALTFQLRDMAGNVSEWVADWYAAYPSEAARNYRGPPTGTKHVTRGTSWTMGDAKMMRAASRSDREPDYRSPMTGFRCAHSNDGASKP